MGISNVSNGLRSGVCTSSTRPIAPYEGQMIYETDTDMVAIWNGSAWRYIAATTPTNGSVLQVVSTSTTTLTSTTSLSYVTTGATATITPKSSSSKILILAQITVSVSSATNNGYVSIFRGSVAGTNLSPTPTAGFGSAYSAGGRIDATIMLSHLDSPATTSATQYTLGMYAASGITFTAQMHNTPTVITLMEIAG